jgi:hypothetical protein
MTDKRKHKVIFLIIVYSLFILSCSSNPDKPVNDNIDKQWADFCQDRSSYIKILAKSVKSCVQKKDTNHRVFHGCIDWHSSVHGYWALLRSYRILNDDSLLIIVNNSFTKNGMDEEYNYLKSNPHFEMPYGRAWFLKLMIEYEIVTGKQDYRYFSNFVAESLKSYLMGRDFEPGIGEYNNQSWAYRNLIEYYIHTNDKSNLSIIYDKLNKSEFKHIRIANDISDPGFFSLEGNLAHLLSLSLKRDDFINWLNFSDITQLPLKPVEKYYNAHHLSINFSRAWSLWSIYVTTKNKMYLKAYMDHVKSGLSLHDRYQESYFEYGHWVPQFGIYAISSSIYSVN